MAEPENVPQSSEFLRLGTCSSPLNPIEEVWSVPKAGVKRRLAVAMPPQLGAAPEHGSAMAERRMRRLDVTIDAAIPLLTPRLSTSRAPATHHVQRHFVACLALAELESALCTVQCIVQ